jgi:hypothetical protein
MNIFIHLLILFIFIFALLMMNIPQIAEDQYIQQKIYIFFGIFIFEFIVSIFITIQRKCVIKLSVAAKSSLQSALVAVVAYSIYNDLDRTGNEWITSYKTDQQRGLVISVMITLFITAGYFLEMLFTDVGPKANDCLNGLYKNNV